MADIIGQETWSVDGKSYVIKVTEPGATVTENAISIISDVRLRKGKPSNGPLHPIPASQTEFTIRDHSRLFRNALAGKQTGDVVLEFTEDSTTLFKGYVIPDFQRASTWKSNPEYKVSSYDGISGLKGFTWDLDGYHAIRSLVYQICTKIGLELRINCILDWEHNNKDSSTDHIDALRIRAEHLLNDGGTYYDALKTLCTFYNAQFFQAGGEWYFMQRHTRAGASVTNYPTSSIGSTLTDETVNYTFTLTDSDLHRKPTTDSYYPANARIVSKHTYPSYLLKNADWTEGNKYWESIGGVAGSNSNQRRLEGDANFLKQTVGASFLISDGSDDRFSIASKAYVKIASGASGTHSLDYLEIKAEATDGTTYYLTGASAWSLTQTYISESFEFASGTTKEIVIGKTTPVMPLSPMRITITLYFDKSASGDAADLEYIEFDSIKVTHLKPDEVDDVFRAEEYVVTENTGSPGENLEEEFSVGDTDDSTFYGTGVWEYYDGTNWLPTQLWAPDSRRVHSKRAVNIKAQTESRQEFYEFSHKFGDRPDLHNSLTYAADATTSKVFIPTFVEQIYSRNAKVWTRTAAIEQLGILLVVATYIYWIDEDNNIKRARITDSPPFTAETLFTSARTLEHIRVHQNQNLIFTLEQSGSTKYITKRTIGESGSTDIISKVTSPDLTAFAIDRVNSKILTIEDLVPGINVELYDYAGTADTQHDTETGGDGGWPAVNAAGTNYFYRYVRTGASPTDEVRKNGTDIPHSTGSAAGNDEDTMLVDETDGNHYVFSVVDQKIIKFSTSGGGESDVVNPANTGHGLGHDRQNQKIYYPGTTSDIWRASYTGTGAEEVVTGNGTTDIVGICLGV